MQALFLDPSSVFFNSVTSAGTAGAASRPIPPIACDPRPDTIVLISQRCDERWQLSSNLQTLLRRLKPISCQNGEGKRDTPSEGDVRFAQRFCHSSGPLGAKLHQFPIKCGPPQFNRINRSIGARDDRQRRRQSAELLDDFGRAVLRGQAQ